MHEKMRKVLMTSNFKTKSNKKQMEENDQKYNEI